MRFKKTATMMMSFLMLFTAAGCTLGGGTNSGGGNGNNGDIGTPDIPDTPDTPDTPDVPDTPVDPVDPNAYVYGDEHLDPYDGGYTTSLLAMGEQAFAYSQLSGVDYFMRERTPNSGNKEGKYVGVFYFLWHNEGNKPYDISKLLETYDPADTEKNPLWALKGSEYYNDAISPMNAFHYFEEPLYGYYASTDRWVIKKHLQLMTQAGVDFLYLDYTNANHGDPNPGNIYPEATYALLDCILELQEEGIECPKIVPVVCNPDTGGKNLTPGQRRASVTTWVYENYYAKDNFKYRSCWFTADPVHNPSGKPLLVSYQLDRNDFDNKDAFDAFWHRDVVWPTRVTPDVYANGFPWMDYELPQKNYNGFMNVSVAQHLGGSWSSEAYLGALKNGTYPYRPRGAHGDMRYSSQGADPEDAVYGLNFNEQWKNALAASGSEEPWCLNVTGWNEWTAQKLDVNNTGRAVFVDTFSLAFSRDAEMMRDKGGYSDNFYMQIAANTAAFKAKTSARKSDAAMWQMKTINLPDLESWANLPKYISLSGKAMQRDAYSVGKAYHYTDDSVRNDIEYLKFANDEENLYVLVSARENITAREEGDEGWMNLYLSTGRGGWQGFNFVINRRPDGKTTSIEKLSEDEEGKVVVTDTEARASYLVKDNCIVYSIPLSALGVTSKSVIGVKACDNIFGVKKTAENDGVGVYSFGDIEAFYCGGVSVPSARLTYAYRMGY